MLEQLTKPQVQLDLQPEITVNRLNSESTDEAGEQLTNIPKP